MKNKKEYLAAISQLIQEGEGMKVEATLSHILKKSKTEGCQYWFSKITTLIQSITSIDEYYYDEVINIIRRSKRQGGIAIDQIDEMIGFLKFLYDAIENDLITKLRNIISASDFNNFLEHAEYYLEHDKKIESSVIISAVFEDSLRQIGVKYKIDKTAKIENIINSLKSKGIITSPAAKQLKYYAGIRNAAFHASWEEYDLNNLKEMLKGVRSIINCYLRD
jgi:uncharacterized protein YutE (UPF0331/DUF86 family)